MPVAVNPELRGVLSLYPVTHHDKHLGFLLRFARDYYDKWGVGAASLPYVSAVMASVDDKLRRLSGLSSHVILLGEPGVGRHDFAVKLFELSNAEMPEPVPAGDTELLAAALESGGSRLYVQDAEKMTTNGQRLLWKHLNGAKHTLLLLTATPELPQLAAEGHFMPDLYRRLSLVTVEIPPLRERREDITALAEYYAEKQAAIRGLLYEGLSAAAKNELCKRDWPGNLTELEQKINKACAQTGIFNLSELEDENHVTPSLKNMRHDFTRRRIEELLVVYGDTVEGKRSAAKELGIGLSSLYRILAKR
jgi:DNA-binding NtrC family response regulator